jgi:3-oxoacyl-[acyl-carrier protein] reductase
MEVGLYDKVVMVSGSTKGLGYGVAKQAALEGARVSIGSRSEENLQHAIEALTSETGAEIYGSLLDVTKPETITTWFDETIEQWGTVDCLVTNAGGPPPGTFDSFDDAQWNAAFELTLLSVVRLVRSVLPVMKEKQRGSILTMTSTSVKEPIDNLLLSNVLRSGVTALAKSLSFELAPYNIRVNNIVPGGYETDRMKALFQDKAKRSGASYEELKKESEGRIPLGRFGTPEEFGKAAVFLISDAASYVSGETFVVDGGIVRTMW